MGVKFARLTLQSMEKNMLRVAASTVPQVRTDMQFLAEQGAQQMQQNIEDRGTDYSAQRYAEGRGTSAGRRDTDEMFESVTWDVSSPAPAVVNAEFGWLENFLRRFGYQELGTRTIEPMFALRDARTEIAMRFRYDMHNILKRAARQIGGR